MKNKNNYLSFFALSFFALSFFVIGIVKVNASIPPFTPLTFRMGNTRTCDTTSCVSGPSTDAKAGGQVSEFQRFLILEGFMPKNIVPTGYYDLITERAAKAYQASLGDVVITGETGDLTRAHMNAALDAFIKEKVDQQAVRDTSIPTGDEGLLGSGVIDTNALPKGNTETPNEVTSPSEGNTYGAFGEPPLKPITAVKINEGEGETSDVAPMEVGYGNQPDPVTAPTPAPTKPTGFFTSIICLFADCTPRTDGGAPVEDRTGTPVGNIQPAPVVAPTPVTEQPTGLFVNAVDGATSAVAGTAHFIVNAAYGVTSAVTSGVSFAAGFISCIGGCAPRTDGIDPANVPVEDRGTSVPTAPGVTPKAVDLFNGTDGGGGDVGGGGGYDGGGGEYSGGGGGGGCFIAGTKILMADLSLKNIEDVVSGDYVMTQTGPSHVTSLKKVAYDGDIYAYNNSGEFFFTPNHPFMTTDGWKSFDPITSMKETPDILVTLADVGDTLIKVSSQEKILSVQKKHTKEFVYNFTVDKSHTYFANGYLVHNIKAEESGQDSSSWFDWSWW